MSTIVNYILVDDDPFNNIISNMELEEALGEVAVTIFEMPEECLMFIEDVYVKDLIPTILFLDINMPTLSGWQFMEKYEKFSDEIKDHIRIYILSSSIDPRDIDRATASKYIKGYIQKPIESQTILSVAG